MQGRHPGTLGTMQAQGRRSRPTKILCQQEQELECVPLQIQEQGSLCSLVRQLMTRDHQRPLETQ